jgi:hypothetical protein
VREFCGWAHTFGGVPNPTFEHVADPTLLARFISFKKSRSDTAQHMSQVMRALQRAVAWLRHNSQYAGLPSYGPHMAKLDEWVNNLAQSVNGNMTSVPKLASAMEPEALQQQGKIMTPQQLMRFVTGLVDEAMTAAREGDADDLNDSQAVQDGLLAAFTFGYLPPIRPDSVLSTLRGPWDKGNPCRHEACQHPSKCPGNIVYQQEQRSQVSLHHLFSDCFKRSVATAP